MAAEKNKAKEQKVVLEVDALRDIKYEGIKKFRSSVLYEAYKSANKITNEIISDNRTLQARKRSGTAGTEIRNLEQIYNILFFTGARGTGKTSSMLSYMEFLKDYYRLAHEDDVYQEMKEFQLGHEKTEFMFTGLEYIDASSLDDKEDIMGSVLSKMMAKWKSEEERSFGSNGIRKDEDYAYKKRQICMRFSKVYEHLKNLRSKSDITEEDKDAFMDTLEKLSLTWNMQRAFQDLVADYLSIMEYPGTENKIGKDNHFLVISIDDLDMNINHGFELLDQIRKYLMGPNIIVLMSANYEQLERICCNHYMAEFEKMHDFEDNRDYVLRLSREYLEKIVPPQRQIVLQSGLKWLFFNGRKLQINYNGDQLSSEGTLEEIIRKDMEQYFGAGFMPDGKCLYYLTPDTIRELCTWIIRTRSLLNEKKEEGVYQNNLRWFWNEEFPLLCKRNLNSNDGRLFETADRLEPFGQFRLMKETLLKEKLIDEKQKDVSLLEIIEELSQGTKREQSLASVITIYFTVKLAELTADMKCSNADRRTAAYRKFIAHFSEGVWGKWEEKMVAPMLKPDTPSTVFVPVGYYRFDKVKDFSVTYLKGKIEIPLEFLETNKEALQCYQLVLLFFRLDIRKTTAVHTMWEIDNQNKLVLQGEYKGFFCLSNPFINLADESSLAYRFIKELPDILCRGQNEKMKEQIKKKIRSEVSIFWENWKPEFLIPLDSVEFLIRTGKEIQTELRGSMVKDLNDDNLKAVIVSYFSIIEHSLNKYDTGKWGKEYQNSPLIQKIKSEDTDFFDQLREAIATTTVPIAEAEEDWSRQYG